MKPVNFKEVNVVFGKDQPEYLPLPAYLKNNAEGEAITCWELTLRERIRFFFTGKIYICTYTFGRHFQPILPVIDKNILLKRG